MKLIPSLTTLCVLATLTTAPVQAQGTIGSPLTVPRGCSANVVMGNLVLIAGGNDGLTYSDRVDIYDATIGPPSNPAAWSIARLSVARTFLGATVVGNLALFAGGWNGSVSKVVDVYDSSIGPPSNSAAWYEATDLSLARFWPSATTVGGKAIFAGGQKFGTVYKRVDIYDSAMGAPDNSAAWMHGPWLSKARAGPTAATVGNLAIFAGGSGVGGTPYADVDFYDNSTGAWTWYPNGLSVPRLMGPNAAAVVGSRVFFAGGNNSQSGGPTMYDTVDIYHAQTGCWEVDTLSQPRGYIGATVVGNTVLFAGGRLTGNIFTDLVETFNVGTGTWCMTCPLAQARTVSCAETVGGVALFAGGEWGAISAVVDVHEPVGLNYCLSTVNSTGAMAGISASGSHSILANDLVLTACNMPDQPGIFIAGSASGQIPFFNGFLCIDPSGLQRFSNATAASGGVIVEAVDLATSAPGGLNVIAGSSYFFQRWYRDPAAGGGNANFSDAIEVTYTP